MPTDYSNLDSLTDDQLIQLGQSLGIDHSSFLMNPPAGVLDFNEPISPQFEVSPEVRDLVAKRYQSQRALGTENIRTAAQAAAGSRGMRLEDTPIGDPYLRAIALLESQLGGEEAQSVLGIGQGYQQFREKSLQDRFGLLETAKKAARAQSFLESQASKEFDLNVADFQSRLRQQAVTNRLQLATTLANLGINLSGQRTGTPTSAVTTAPPDVAGGFGLIGRGIQAATLTPTNSAFQNMIIASALGLNPNTLTQ